MLPTNRITEKIFVFYWFWLIFLLVITFISLIYYSTLFFAKSPRWRDKFLAIAINDTKVRRSLQSWLVYLEQEFQMARSRGEMTRQKEVHEYLAEMPATHFFFLYLVGLNVDYGTLKDLSHEMLDLVGLT